MIATDLGARQDAALAPLRESLIAAAAADAGRARRNAEQAAARRLVDAASEADGIRSAAHRLGEDDVAAQVADAASAARRTQRATVLAEQRTAVDRLRQDAAAAVRAALAAPRRRAAFGDLLTARLGGARIVDAPDGGLIAIAPDGRRLDGSVAALVAAALADLDLEGLWRR